MRSLVVTLAAMLLIAGCGAEDAEPKAEPSPSSSPSAPPTAPEPTVDEQAVLKKAVQKYSDAFLAGRGTEAYDLLSARCQKRMGKSEFLDIVTQAKATYGSALAIKTFDATISGDLARVTYTYDVPAINQDAEPWVREGGQWREDDC